MNEIEILKELFREKDLDLNELDICFKLIDIIFVDVLKWFRDVIEIEKYIEGNRVDYVLKGKNDKFILVFESKKNGVYFELFIIFNKGKLFEKI